MTREREALKQFGDETRSHGPDVSRLQERLREEGWVRDPGLAAPTGILAAFRRWSEPLEDGAHRVAARVRASMALGRARNRGLMLAGVAAAVALAAWPRTAPLDVQLQDGADSPAFVSETGRLALTYDGEGTVSGTEQAPRMQWRSGSVDVEVEPNRGTDFRLVTPEAEVRVLGTAFSVDRNALGTTTLVSRGRVSVQCVGGEEVELAAGQSITCWPTTPAGLLGRGRRLIAADPPAALAALDRGAELAEPGPVAVELAFARLEALVTDGREADARAAANEWLAVGAGHRQPAVAELAATLALRLDGCAGAQSELAALSAGDPLLEGCR